MRVRQSLPRRQPFRGEARTGKQIRVGTLWIVDLGRGRH
jgi:hypothetical protein